MRNNGTIGISPLGLLFITNVNFCLRNADRQLSNVEAIPGGLNILSGLYQNLQESTNFEPFDKSTGDE